MRKIKIHIYIIILIILINVTINPVYANELEEIGLTREEMDEILQTVTDVEDIPTINSRNAIIYDRISRKNYIWKKRKCKM